jgi:hypothetical protein
MENGLSWQHGIIIDAEDGLSGIGHQTSHRRDRHPYPRCLYDLEKEEEKTAPHHINDSEARDLLRKL